MKKVITMVGTSLFDNFFKENEGSDLSGSYERLKERKGNYWNDEQASIKKLKKGIEKWISKCEKEDEIKVSAEIKSLIKLKEELKEDLEIYLLCSDTILSKLAGEIIKSEVEKFGIGTVKLHDISGLQIWDREEFKRGMANLIQKIYDIANYYWENVIINITGGFKAVIPFLTILAQVNRCPIYYIFEDTDTLIKIPTIPFSKELIDLKELDKYCEFLIKLEKGITEEAEYQSLKNSEFYQKYSFLIWEEPPLAELNPIGKIFFEKYKEKVFVFYGTDEVEEKIKNSENLEKVVLKVANPSLRQAKTEIKNGHYVFDDGDNQRRVFYREIEGILCIYKVFDNHKIYENYLKTAFSEKILDPQNFKLLKLWKEE